MKRLRRYLLEGLALVAPIGATLWVLWWLFTRLDRILGGYIGPWIGRDVPGLGLIALLVLLILTGWLTERTLGRRATRLWEWVVDHVPIARPVYKGSRRIFQSLVGQEARAFRKAVAVEYPSPGIWAIAFETGHAPEALSGQVGPGALSVFLPTAPNPMSGFLLVVPREKVLDLPVSTEAAFTFVVSMGAVPLAGEGAEVVDRVRHATPGAEAER